MEQQNKKDEIQSRREFFKAATKKALPIIGAVALMSNPVIAQVMKKEATGCEYGGCYGLCTTSCGHNDCKGGCRGGCSGCEGSCQGGCKGSCEATCSGTCKYGCTSKNQF